MRALLPLLLALPVLACGADETTTADTDPAAETLAPAVPVAEGEVEVRCGCGIESAPGCGNYAHVGDAWLEIANWKELGLGKMEWCKQQHAGETVHAVVAGEAQGDKVTLTKLDVQ